MKKISLLALLASQLIFVPNNIHTMSNEFSNVLKIAGALISFPATLFFAKRTHNQYLWKKHVEKNNCDNWYVYENFDDCTNKIRIYDSAYPSLYDGADKDVVLKFYSYEIKKDIGYTILSTLIFSTSVYTLYNSYNTQTETQS